MTITNNHPDFHWMAFEDRSLYLNLYHCLDGIRSLQKDVYVFFCAVSIECTKCVCHARDHPKYLFGWLFCCQIDSSEREWTKFRTTHHASQQHNKLKKVNKNTSPNKTTAAICAEEIPISIKENEKIFWSNSTAKHFVA